MSFFQLMFLKSQKIKIPNLSENLTNDKWPLSNRKKVLNFVLDFLPFQVLCVIFCPKIVWKRLVLYFLQQPAASQKAIRFLLSLLKPEQTWIFSCFPHSSCTTAISISLTSADQHLSYAEGNRSNVRSAELRSIICLDLVAIHLLTELSFL